MSCAGSPVSIPLLRKYSDPHFRASQTQQFLDIFAHMRCVNCMNQSNDGHLLAHVTQVCVKISTHLDDPFQPKMEEYAREPW